MSDSGGIILIGVDGGGTGCRAALAAADQTVLAQADGGQANVTTDFDASLRNIIACIDRAADLAGITPQQRLSAAVHLGLAGVTSDAIAARVAQALPYRRIRVTDDRPTAVAGALDGRDGFLMAIGTGCFTASSRGGVVRYVGGWGFHASDQGSGAWLGWRLIELVFLCIDGVAAHSPLTRATLARFDNDPDRMVAFSRAGQPDAYAALAPQIVGAAASGDPIGRLIMRDGAAHLETGLRALNFQPGDALCLTGGVAGHYAAFLADRFTANLIAPKGTSLQGALQLAAQISPAVAP